MKRRINQCLLMSMLAISAAFLGGCRDVFEKDITNKQLSVNSPTDGAVNSVYNQLFWWNKLDGATQYSIQIVTPSFDSVQTVVSDTVVGDVDKFYKTLDPGKYQWRIRAENGSYKTNYQVYSLTMLESPLENQVVTLVSPANNTYKGKDEGSVDLKWEKVYGATNYDVQVDSISVSFSASSTLINTTDVYTTYTFPKSGDYKWRVKAKNDASEESQWSSVYYVGFRSALPGKPTLITPSTDSSVTSNASITFKWNTVPTASSYKIRIYKQDDNTLIKEQEVTTNSYSYLFNLSGVNVYWYVVSVDKANQESEQSDNRILKF